MVGHVTKSLPCSEPLPTLASLAIAHGWGAGQVMDGWQRTAKAPIRLKQCGQAVMCQWSDS